MSQEKEEWISACPSTAASPGASSVHVSEAQNSERFADASLGDTVPAAGLRAVSIPAADGDSVSTASVIMHSPTPMHVTQVTGNSPMLTLLACCILSVKADSSYFTKLSWKYPAN